MATDPSGLIAQLLSPQGINGFQAGLQNYQDRQQQQQANQQQLALGALKLGAAQQQQMNAQRYTQAVNDWIMKGAPADGLANLSAQFPDQAEALQNSWKFKNETQKQSDLNFNAQIVPAADGGRADLVTKQLQDRKRAVAAAGGDTSALDDTLQLIAKDPKAGLAQAKAIALSQIYAYDPASFIKQYGPQKQEAEEFSNTPQGVIYSKRTGQSVSGPGGALSNAPDQLWGRILQAEGGVGPNGEFRTSPKGAIGPAQLLPGTARDAAALAGVPFDDQRYRTDAAYNAQLGQAYFNKQLADFGDPSKAAAAYNAGPGAVQNAVNKYGSDWLSHLPSETKAYVAKTTGIGAATANPELLSDDATKLLAQQYLSGDKSVFTNLGRGKQGAQNVVKVREEIAHQAAAQGLNGAGIAAKQAEFTGDLAASRAAGTRLAQVETAANEAKRLAPIALRTSNILDRVGWLPLARVQQAIRNGSNDPKYRAFNAANNAFVNAYSRAVSPTGTPTVQDKQHAYDLLNTAFDKTSYEATVHQMQQEIDAALAAPADTRAGIRSAITGQPAQTAQGGASGFKILRVRPAS